MVITRTITLEQCLRCGHEWQPRIHKTKNDKPVACPKCRSPYYNKPRKNERER